MAGNVLYTDFLTNWANSSVRVRHYGASTLTNNGLLIILSAHVSLFNDFNAQFTIKIAIIMDLNIVEIDIPLNKDKKLNNT